MDEENAIEDLDQVRYRSLWEMLQGPVYVILQNQRCGEERKTGWVRSM
jgi:hypothetical protein